MIIPCSEPKTSEGDIWLDYSNNQSIIESDNLHKLHRKSSDSISNITINRLLDYSNQSNNYLLYIFLAEIKELLELNLIGKLSQRVMLNPLKDCSTINNIHQKELCSLIIFSLPKNSIIFRYAEILDLQTIDDQEIDFLKNYPFITKPHNILYDLPLAPLNHFYAVHDDGHKDFIDETQYQSPVWHLLTEP